VTDSVLTPVRGNVRIKGTFREPRDGYKHLGTDFGPQTPGVPGDPVQASVTGMLVYKGSAPGFGKVAVIERDNGDGTYLYFIDAHLAKYNDRLDGRDCVWRFFRIDSSGKSPAYIHHRRI
jgi:hypothetical protein